LEDVKAKADAIEYVSGPPAQYNPTRCSNPAIATGYAQALMDQTSLYGSTIGDATAITKTSSSGSRPYKLKRTATASSATPYNVLKLDYKVYRGSDTTFSSPIATYYTEVIPGASFFCKQ
jgi:hypothetical protein